MGFYPPASLVRDAQRRGVEVRPPDVNRSEAKCALEDDAVRIGLEYVRSLGEEEAEALVAERARAGPFAGVASWRSGAGSTARGSRRSSPPAPATRSATGGACCSGSSGSPRARRPFPAARGRSGSSRCRSTRRPRRRRCAEQSPWERMLADYRTTSLSVGVHPLALLRPHLPDGTLSSRELRGQPSGGQVAVAGMAVARQRPATANGVVFMLLEDEFGQINLIVPPAVYERFRPLVRAEPLLLARGRFERLGRNRNVRRARARVARPARPPLCRRRRRLRLAAGRPPLRPSLKKACRARRKDPSPHPMTGGALDPPPSRSTVPGRGARVCDGSGPIVGRLLHSGAARDGAGRGQPRPELVPGRRVTGPRGPTGLAAGRILPCDEATATHRSATTR